MAKKKPAAKQQPPKQEEPKAKPKAKKRYWAKRLYVKGFGMVDVGEEASAEALAAWKKATKVKVDNYLTE